MKDALGRTVVWLYIALGITCFSSSCIYSSLSKISEKPSEQTATNNASSVEHLAVTNIDGQLKNVGGNQGSERESERILATDRWAALRWVLAILIAAGVTRLVDQSNRAYLFAGFASSFVLLALPQLWVAAMGVVGLLVCVGFLAHMLVPKFISENSVFIGIALAFFAYTFAVAGGLAANRDLKPLERYSTALYEATQLPLMNMSPHEKEQHEDARVYFVIARTLGCLFAYFVAYKAVVYMCHRARKQSLLVCYRLHNSRPVALVFGLGAVGRRLIRNLGAANYRVVAIEADKDSVHIERAEAMGAQVIVGDALDDRVYEKLPFDAAKSIYVVAGDDRTNLEIGQQLLTYSAKRAPRKNTSLDTLPWYRRILFTLKGRMLKDVDAVCHVQLYDPNMQRLMEHEHFCQPVEESGIEMRHFNAQQNAVRDLIQSELTKQSVRPESVNDVGLYIIVGFDDLGQEAALGIAHLAHFANLKRSRILIFCSDPLRDSSSFLARYPNFTADNHIQLDWKTLKFDQDRDNWNYEGGRTARDCATEEACAKFGNTFATNAVFTTMPSSPSDRSFLNLIYRLTQPRAKRADDTRLDCSTTIKPCVIVCDSDVSGSFKWSSEFVAAWKAFAKRNDLQPECHSGAPHPSLNTYFWLQGHKALRDVVEDNVRHIAFGLEERCISIDILDATLIRQLAGVVQYSYDLATSAAPMEETKSSAIKPVKFEFLKSNIHAAAHSLIKFQVAGQKIEHILSKESITLMASGEVESFELDGRTYYDPTAAYDVEEERGLKLTDQQKMLLKLGMMEHNRWVAEQLMKGYEFIDEEKERVGGKRLPQHEHQRATLCSWNQLNDDEKVKDLRQAYYVLYHLHSLQSSKGMNAF